MRVGNGAKIDMHFNFGIRVSLLCLIFAEGAAELTLPILKKGLNNVKKPRSSGLSLWHAFYAAPFSLAWNRVINDEAPGRKAVADRHNASPPRGNAGQVFGMFFYLLFFLIFVQGFCILLVKMKRSFLICHVVVVVVVVVTRHRL